MKWNIHGIDLRALGIFRISLGLAIGLDFAFSKLPNFTAFFTDEGIFTSEILRLVVPNYACTPMYFVTSYWGALLFFVAAFVFTLTNLIPHLGQLPGEPDLTSGCIGQVYVSC